MSSKSSKLLLLSLASLVSFVSSNTEMSFTAQGHHKSFLLNGVTHIEVPLETNHINGIKHDSLNLFVSIESKNGSATYTLSARNPQASDRDDLDDDEFKRKPSQIIRIDGQSEMGVPHVTPISQSSVLWRDLQVTRTLYITLTAKVPNTRLYVTTLGSESFPMELGLNHKANVEGVEKLRLRAMFSHSPGNHHFKFLVESLQHNNKNYKLEGYGVKGDKEPTPENKQFDFAKFDVDRIGTVIDSSSKNLYCNAGTCTYTVTIVPSGIKTLSMYAAEHSDFEILMGSANTVFRS